MSNVSKRKFAGATMPALIRHARRAKWLNRPKAVPLVNAFKRGTLVSAYRPYRLLSDLINDVGERHIRVSGGKNRSKYMPTGKRS